MLGAGGSLGELRAQSLPSRHTPSAGDVGVIKQHPSLSRDPRITVGGEQLKGRPRLCEQRQPLSRANVPLKQAMTSASH